MNCHQLSQSHPERNDSHMNFIFCSWCSLAVPINGQCCCAVLKFNLFWIYRKSQKEFMAYISCSRSHKGKVQGIPAETDNQSQSFHGETNNHPCYIHSYRQFRITFRAQTQAVSNPLAISGGRMKCIFPDCMARFCPYCRWSLSERGTVRGATQTISLLWLPAGCQSHT